ncbi:TPA: repressor LexA [candidate division CPR2 bacterium]|uniref:Polymerase V subunit protein n=1 Tax=candidate division CPR2 bacterium GW2011_GWC1_41_48 TaxID=1618344 RepID=A0A0G0WA42_UNCC2|nr:MAG: polymerase V subunit protein [candidate division CPR2 bacterium GW2011_GWC2_39_35]KKR28867.1 MAG: polymerase V subunit protein [candidate division CPR2 bacterium GW2011_GWD1_39_7]KKS09874.1 MAG: polymerase V subunit protein [candidate division CPR2 bacterium GW2011_GWC1_41_48]OGB61496.1 MAG: repressor LexA [candidate division CPR2 bacterium GWD1_39_7]HBG81668.1 repressor LexA [candidate division CPR2 bacterium]
MQEIYEQRKRLLNKFYDENKRLPSYSEMLSLFSLKSKNTIAYLIQKLIDDGFLEKDQKGRLIPKKLFSGIKLLGTVEAGFPTPAEEELADTITLDQYLITKREATFLLKVSGESMTGAGICPGDLVLIERGRTPKHGDVVVAEVDDEWTIKTFEKLGGHIILVPANPKFKTIVPKESLNIAGVVVAVVRKYH